MLKVGNARLETINTTIRTARSACRNYQGGGLVYPRSRNPPALQDPLPTELFRSPSEPGLNPAAPTPDQPAEAQGDKRKGHDEAPGRAARQPCRIPPAETPPSGSEKP
jgi:hypothetical protein